MSTTQYLCKRIDYKKKSRDDSLKLNTGQLYLHKISYTNVIWSIKLILIKCHVNK